MEFRLATKNDFEACVELLTESFRDYEFFNIYVKNENRRLRFLKAVQEVGLRKSLKNGIVLLGISNNQIVAVAELNKPNTKAHSIFDYFLLGGFKLITIAGPVNAFGWLDMYIQGGKACEELPPHWCLTIFAIANGFKGQGFGGEMIKNGVVPYVLNNGGGTLCLATNSETNRNFYLKSGFEEFECKVIKKNGKDLINYSFKMEIQ